MARTKLDALPVIELPALDGDALTANQNLMAAMIDSHSGERDLVNQLLGQAQMADAFAKFSVTVTTSKLAYVKESKLYRGLKDTKSGHGDQFLAGTWDEFCGLIGRSREQVDRDIANLRAFGEEALESMSRMGIGYREMRQYRRLPEDHQAALIEIAKTGDKDAFIDLAEEIIAKHAKEKEALTQQLDNVNADYETQGEMLATKRQQLNVAEEELARVRKRIQLADPDDTIKDLRVEVIALKNEFVLTLLGKLREGFTKMAKHGESTGQDHRFYQADLIRDVEIELGMIRSEFFLPEHKENEKPVWMNEGKA